MIPKGRQGTESPEKMPVVTAGLQMSRAQHSSPPLRENLTGGNQPADETLVAKLVTDDIIRTKG